MASHWSHLLPWWATGGEEVLLEPAVADVSESFKDVGPSSDAREMPKQPYIVMCIQMAPSLKAVARAPW